MRKWFMIFCIGLSLVLAVTASAGTPTYGTVNYSGFTGFTSVDYTSEFYGYQAAMNRDFTNYGFKYNSESSDVINVVWNSNMHFRLADISLYLSTSNTTGFAFRMSRGDGTFGPKPIEIGTKMEYQLRT